MNLERFVNDYVNSYKEALGSEWDEISKKEQRAEILAAADSGAIQFEKLRAIYNHDKATSSVIDHHSVWRHMVARSCREYRAETDRQRAAQTASLPQAIIDQLTQ